MKRLLSYPGQIAAAAMSSPHRSSFVSANSRKSDDSSKARGLPEEEYRALQKRQQRSQLETHFTEQNRSISNLSKTAYQKALLPGYQRLHISQANYATYKALGESFDFTDDSFDRLQSPSVSMSIHLRHSYKEPIPQRYIDEFNKKWHEDDMRYDKSRYNDDFSHRSYREHPTLSDLYGQMYLQPTSLRSCVSTIVRGNAPTRSLSPDVGSKVDSGYEGSSTSADQQSFESEAPTKFYGPNIDDHRQPRLISKFSFESEEDMHFRSRAKSFLHLHKRSS